MVLRFPFLVLCVVFGPRNFTVVKGRWAKPHMSCSKERCFFLSVHHETVILGVVGRLTNPTLGCKEIKWSDICSVNLLTVWTCKPETDREPLTHLHGSRKRLHQTVTTTKITARILSFTAGTHRFGQVVVDTVVLVLGCWPESRVCHPCLCPPVSQKLDDGTSSPRLEEQASTAGQEIRDARN